MIGLKSLFGRSASDIDTPTLLINLDRLEANIHRYAEQDELWLMRPVLMVCPLLLDED